MALVQKALRALRLLWGFFYPTAIIIIIVTYTYTMSVRCFGRVLGPAIWFTIFILLGFWVWREAGRVLEQKRCYGHLSPEKFAPVSRLRETVSAVEAYNSAHTWKDYLPFGRRWQRMKRPPKPSLDDIEAAFKECEDVVGPADYNIRLALTRLSTVLNDEKDPPFQINISLRIMKIAEETYGKDSEKLILICARLGALYSLEKRWKESADTLERAIELQKLHSKSGSQINESMNDEKKLRWQWLQALALSSAKENDAAENVLRSMLAELQQNSGVLHSEGLGEQEVMGMLLGVYIKQGWDTIKKEKVNTAGYDTLRYMHEATMLISKIPTSRATNLKSLGRLFIWAGKITDGETAFRLANNSATEDLKNREKPSVCLSCGGNHESFRVCDVCAKEIQVNQRWLFCKSCVDVDLCGECYDCGAEERDWEDLDKFPRQCLEHEFFDVNPNEKEERWTDDMWIADICERLKAELECGPGVG